MGVMQVARPLKPQDSRCVAYLVDAKSKKEQANTAVCVVQGSQKKVAGAIFAYEKTQQTDLNQIVEFSEGSPSCAKDIVNHNSRKQNIEGAQKLHVVESGDSGFTRQDFEHTFCYGVQPNNSKVLKQSCSGYADSTIKNSVDEILQSYRNGKATVGNVDDTKIYASSLRPENLRRIEVISNDIEGQIVRCYKEQREHPALGETEMKRVTRKKAPDMKVQTCGRGRPRKKSLGKRGGGSCDKQSSQDGSENGEGKAGRGRQQRNSGQGNGGSGGGRRRRDDDDREDENDDIEDDFDENNEEDDEEEDEQTGTESVVDETELTPEQEAEMAQELLCLIPPKNMNCDPPEKPAKPGTVVNLHGVVLHETSGGLIVLNVRWRNKIYSGALIDVRKSRWASERIKPDPYPEGAHVKPADLLKLNGKRKGKKAKSPDLNDKDSKEPVDIKSEQLFKEPSGVPVVFKRPSDSSSGDGTDTGIKKKARLSPPPIECPEPNCGKRYSHKNGLKYHQAHAHQNKSDAEETKPVVTVTTQRTSGADSDPSSTTVVAHQKILVEQKPLIAQQSIVELSGTAIKPVGELAPGSVATIKKIKTEEENAVDSIKDVQFEESEKSKEGLPDVPKIMLEPSTGEEPTELIGATEGGRMEVIRPESLFPSGTQASLVPFNSRVNFAQFSPTLNPLNPQTINNSLSHALQTASSKSAEKFESEGDKRANPGPENDMAESRDDARSKLRLDEVSSVAGDAASSVRRFGFDKDIKCEDTVPASPDDLVSVNDLLPGSLGSHLFPRETKPGLGAGQGTSYFLASLYNQISQDQARKQFAGGDFTVTPDLAELDSIRKAFGDGRPHLSPMLLTYLNAGQRARETVSEHDGNADEVSTSGKTESCGKSSRKAEGKDGSNPSTASFSPMSSLGRERPSGVLAQKSEFLQPNISVGRPIMKPATKPESITGGQKVVSRFGNQGHFSEEKQKEDGSQNENQTIGDARTGTPKNLSPTSYADKQLIEAKTWTPKEVHWQPHSKKGVPLERSQFSPGKDKTGRDQSTPGRVGVEMDKKSTSPFDHGGADYMRSRGTSPSQSNRKGKQGSIPYPNPPISTSSIDAERAKQLERHSENSQDGSDTPRFTLSDDKSASSPAEKQSRKVRVERTQQIPVGNAKDVEGSRGAPEHGSRKQTTACSYARTSVIHSMSTPLENIRPSPAVKEEYVSPEGRRKSPAVSQERLAYDKKFKQDYRKSVSRQFEAEREKLKTGHVDSHYAYEVRNMQLRAQELSVLPKSDIPVRGSLSPGSKIQSLSLSALEKGDRHSRERYDAKSIPVYGQTSSFATHPSEIEKFRPEYLHEAHRFPLAFSSLHDSYPPLSSYFAPRAAISQTEPMSHQRLEQMMSSHMDAKFEKGMPLKLAQEASKHSLADRLRPSSRDGHTSRPAFYAHASPLSFQSREPGSASCSPKDNPLEYRLSQRMEGDIIAKDSKSSLGDSRRDARRDPGGYSYGPPYFHRHFPYPSPTSSKPYPQRLSDQRSPYKHPSEMDKPRYPSHSNSQAHSGPGGMLSANLVLTQADSLGYGSIHYENRNPDAKK